MMVFVQLIAAALVLNLLVMTLCFWYARSRAFYSVVDPVWSFSVPATAVLYALIGPAPTERALLLAIPPLLWGGRLGLHIATRLISHFPKEDGRYHILREEYLREGRTIEGGFFRFFLFQGLSVVILSAPFLSMALDPSPAIGGFAALGALVWGVGFSGESLADFQMRRFRAQNPGKTCTVGLWRYSRHPNYFFESVVWWGYFLMACDSPGGWASIYCPFAILYLLLRVTGVPYAEAQSLRSKGEEYRSYQRRTSAFVPWFPRRG